MAEPERTIFCHPDDVNLADAKAVAARYRATLVGCRFMPRGQMFLTNGALFRLGSTS